MIKNAAAAQTKAGRDPGKYGSLHLFVITNVTDEGIGAGTVNTQRMLESLGRADTMPNVTKAMQIGALSNKPPIYYDPRDPAARKKLAEYEEDIKNIRESTIVPESRPGLKVHICSLVAPDSPPITGCRSMFIRS